MQLKLKKSVSITKDDAINERIIEREIGRLQYLATCVVLIIMKKTKKVKTETRIRTNIQLKSKYNRKLTNFLNLGNLYKVTLECQGLFGTAEKQCNIETNKPSKSHS